MQNKLFDHIFINNHAKKTLFLLHGTGGDKKDLLPIVDPLKSRYNFVGIQGNILENGMARFFERKDLGVFDRQSIEQEAKKLKEFIQSWKKSHKLDTDQTAFLGYSNGANMILALVFLYPNQVSKAVLLHPMLPFVPENDNLTGKSLLVTYGETDQMIPLRVSKKLVDTLTNLKVNLQIVSHPGGHELRNVELESLIQFLED